MLEYNIKYLLISIVSGNSIQTFTLIKSNLRLKMNYARYKTEAPGQILLVFLNSSELFPYKA